MNKLVQAVRKIIVEIILEVIPFIIKMMEILYNLRHVWIILILTVYHLSFCTTHEEIYVSILISVSLYAIYLVCKRGHQQYIVLKRRTGMATKKKFLYHDVFGNPSIEMSDLPEIIEFLDQYEKGETL